MTQSDLDFIAKNALSPDVSLLKELTQNQPGFTAVYNGEPVGIGGINWFWDGVGEAWVMFSKNISNCRFGLYRATRQIFKLLLERHTFRRIQATVRVDWPEAIKMVEKLGFKREAKLTNYCPDGTDVYMYAMVK